MTNAEEFYRHAGYVRALARRLVVCEQTADDVTQDTLLAALRTPWSTVRRWRPWLAGVVRHRVGRLRRAGARRRRREQTSAPGRATPPPGRIVEREEVLGMVRAAVEALDERYKAVVTARYYDSLPPREIAARLCVPVETVRTRLKRALAQVRQHLDQTGASRESWQLGLAAAIGLRLPAELLGVGGGKPPATAPSTLRGSVRESPAPGRPSSWPWRLARFRAVAGLTVATGAAALLTVQLISPSGPASRAGRTASRHAFAAVPISAAPPGYSSAFATTHLAGRELSSLGAADRTNAGATEGGLPSPALAAPEEPPPYPWPELAPSSAERLFRERTVCLDFQEASPREILAFLDDVDLSVDVPAAVYASETEIDLKLNEIRAYDALAMIAAQLDCHVVYEAARVRLEPDPELPARAATRRLRHALQGSPVDEVAAGSGCALAEREVDLELLGADVPALCAALQREGVRTYVPQDLWESGQTLSIRTGKVPVRECLAYLARHTPLRGSVVRLPGSEAEEVLVLLAADVVRRDAPVPAATLRRKLAGRLQEVRRLAG